MERRNKRNIAIGILCTLLVFMGVGYAALNQVLDINGTARSTNTWSVLIESITKKASSDGVTSTERVGVDNTKPSDNATFSVEFIKPGDYIEYDVVVKNSGTIAGQVSEVNFTTTNTELFTTSFDNSIINKTILPGGSETFTIRIEYNSEATALVTGEEQFELVLTSIQGEGSNIPPDAGEEDDWLYKVNSDGLITAFNYDSPYAKVNGNYVANVPAEIDGIPVTSIDKNSFLAQHNVMFSGEADVVIIDEKNWATLTQGFSQIISLMGKPELTYHHASEGIDTTDFLAFYFDIDAYNNNNQRITEDNFEEILVQSSTKLSALDFSQATNLTTIGDNAFEYSELINLNLGSTITTIGNEAFSDNRISSLTIPNSVITIGNGAFYGNQISNLTLGIGLRTIENEAFFDNQISSLIIPNGVTAIGNSAFSYNQISSLTIGSGVTSISSDAFGNQRDSDNNATLTSITIKRTETDFLTNVNVGVGGWYDNYLTPTITYNQD